VYDIRNCGSRNRFVVQGETGEVLIVHNCGVVYDGRGNELILDVSPRINEVMDITGEKIEIFIGGRNCTGRNGADVWRERAG
jgi:hypothetical protein